MDHQQEDGRVSIAFLSIVYNTLKRTIRKIAIMTFLVVNIPRLVVAQEGFQKFDLVSAKVDEQENLNLLEGKSISSTFGDLDKVKGLSLLINPTNRIALLVLSDKRVPIPALRGKDGYDESVTFVRKDRLSESIDLETVLSWLASDPSEIYLYWSVERTVKGKEVRYAVLFIFSNRK